MNNEKLYNLKQSELNVLNVLWKENEPLMASEISKRGGLVNSTVQVALRDLKANEIISVMDIVVNVTALSRKYVPNITMTDYENILMARDLKNIAYKSVNNSSFVMSLLNQSDHSTVAQEVDALQNLLNEYRAELKAKGILKG